MWHCPSYNVCSSHMHFIVVLLRLCCPGDLGLIFHLNRLETTRILIQLLFSIIMDIT